MEEINQIVIHQFTSLIAERDHCFCLFRKQINLLSLYIVFNYTAEQNLKRESMLLNLSNVSQAKLWRWNRLSNIYDLNKWLNFLNSLCLVRQENLSAHFSKINSKVQLLDLHFIKPITLITSLSESLKLWFLHIHKFTILWESKGNTFKIC